jgi:hypothetical protein
MNTRQQYVITPKETMPAYLWQDTRPRTVECAGAELFPTIASLDGQGAHVESVSRIRGTNAKWLLRIHWPPGNFKKTVTKDNELGKFGHC